MITKLLAATIASCGVIVLAAPDVPLSDAMPVAQQNALVQKYCAVCHTDVHRNGGLSLQHFDAAHPSDDQNGEKNPSLSHAIRHRFNLTQKGVCRWPYWAKLRYS
jgi:hypothetical protein